MDSHGKPLIVQSDSSLLLDVHDTSFEDARANISLFSELEKSPEHIHTYKISPLSLWNAASAGISAQRIHRILDYYSRYMVPENIVVTISETIEKFGKLRLLPSDEEDILILDICDEAIKEEVRSTVRISSLIEEDGGSFKVDLKNRGTLKQQLIKIGYPVKDEAPLVHGDFLGINFRAATLSGRPFQLRNYQTEAAGAFTGLGIPGTGFGTVVLPCGSGKTIIGIMIMEKLKTNTLILAPNVASVHQWMDELLDKTSIKSEDIGEYTGSRKQIKPITIATYQILVYNKKADFPHFTIFKKRNWQPWRRRVP